MANKESKYVRVSSWEDLAKRRAVYRDAHGEHVRLFTGGRVYKNANPHIFGTIGFVIKPIDQYTSLVAAGGESMALPTEVLTPVEWDNLRCMWR